MNDASTPEGNRRARWARLITPVICCLAVVGLHAYFHVPKGKYAPRPSPEAIKRHRAKLQRHRMQRQQAERRARERQAAEQRKGGAEQRPYMRQPTQ